MRKLVTDIFNEWIESSSKPQTIAVVGGDSTEPELEHLSDSKITFYGIENTNNDPRFRELDLNTDHPHNTYNEKYDLVLCSQVIEHLYDVSNSIKTITGLVKPGGYVWLGFPSSNFEVIISGHLGSRRNYLWTHTLREWPSLNELNNPIRFIWRSPVSLPRKIIRTLRRLRQANVVFSNNRVSNEIEWATESYLLAKNTGD